AGHHGSEVHGDLRIAGRDVGDDRERHLACLSVTLEDHDTFDAGRRGFGAGGQGRLQGGEVTGQTAPARFRGGGGGSGVGNSRGVHRGRHGRLRRVARRRIDRTRGGVFRLTTAGSDDDGQDSNDQQASFQGTSPSGERGKDPLSASLSPD